MTNPTPEAVEAVAALWDESCRAPRTYPGMVMACQQCIGCRVSIDALAFIRDAIHRDGPDADAIREALGLQWRSGDQFGIPTHRRLSGNWKEKP